MSSREIAKLTRKEHKNVIRDIWEMVEDLYGISKAGSALSHKKNQTVTLYNGIDVTVDGRSYVSHFRLDKPHVECLLTGYSAKLRMIVIQHIYKLEEQINRRDLPVNYKEALLALVALETEKEQIASERDEAIETKAWIGEKREATAMATASVEKKKANKLAERLGEGKNYAAIIPVEKKLNQKFKWQPLRKWCRENDATPHDVEDPRFGSVKSWPRAAWLAVYGVDLRKLF